MSFWDDITAGVGNAANAVGLGDVGLGPDFEVPIPAHAVGVPVQPSADMTDADLRAWRLTNASAFENGGLHVDANGDLSKVANYNIFGAVGATSGTSPSEVFSQSVVGQLSGIGSGIGGIGGSALSGLKSVAIGAGVLLGLILLIELVKK